MKLNTYIAFSQLIAKLRSIKQELVANQMQIQFPTIYFW